ncbi:MAG: hypothetical protein HWN65_10705 [Candidatus Helarchaeota archaeon]|nr:hypothetical protein [Candidatus Helarchaeota archaeon]
MFEIILVGIFTIVGSVIGYLVSYFFEKRRDDRVYNREVERDKRRYEEATEQRRIDLLRSHLPDFFAPLVNRLSKIRFKLRSLRDYDPDATVIVKPAEIVKLPALVKDLNDFLKENEVENILYLPIDLPIIIKHLDEKFKKNLYDKVNEGEEISVRKNIMPLQYDVIKLILDIQKILGMEFPDNMGLFSDLDEFKKTLSDS